ncbi:complement C1q tumor necrosis factor-related protein 4-like [Anneissia japonica]|uniref:complement C1q tumor necrosis factor-related protein 4-like n=1 Tax=Anneissia japonica TaxID=1529436 RepID=UPI0014258338|nr:complement C1q tumor necrosis factor-related protein 4-like [Anneissia japonica]
MQKSTCIIGVCMLLATYVVPSFAASKYFLDSAFSAKYMGTINRTVSETITGFEEPDLNRGNDFDKSTGIFTCEFPGTYYFEVDIHLSDDQTVHRLSTNLFFINNGNNFISLSNLKILNSQTGGVVDLAIGDKVQLEVPYELVETFDTDHPLVFLGFLLDHDCHCGGQLTRESSFSVVNSIQNGESIPLGNVTYQEALSNVGNCIDSNTGIFTAPYTGLYYFTFTAVTRGVSTFEISRNSEAVLSMTDGADFDSLSGSIILELTKGDKVYLEYAAGGPINTQGGSIVFSGFLL